MFVLTHRAGFGGRRRVSGGGGGVLLTLADLTSGIYAYYTASSPNSLTPGTPQGSKSGEPVAGQTMVEFIVGPFANWVCYTGDAVSALTGKSVWINGVNYPFDSADWYYYGVDGHTYGEWAAGAPPVSASTYTLEIK